MDAGERAIELLSPSANEYSQFDFYFSSPLRASRQAKESAPPSSESIVLKSKGVGLMEEAKELLRGKTLAQITAVVSIILSSET